MEEGASQVVNLKVVNGVAFKLQRVDEYTCLQWRDLPP